MLALAIWLWHAVGTRVSNCQISKGFALTVFDSDLSRPLYEGVPSSKEPLGIWVKKWEFRYVVGGVKTTNLEH